MNSTEQKIPKWFDGSVYNEGDKVTNKDNNRKLINDFDKALSWFKKNNVKAYMALLD